jgi:hypothetical protein
MAIEASLQAERRHMENQANDNASLSWNCSRPATRPRSLSGATLPAIPTTG